MKPKYYAGQIILFKNSNGKFNVGTVKSSSYKSYWNSYEILTAPNYLGESELIEVDACDIKTVDELNF